ncbi:tRNA (adenosine(37)-N6)-dimethylallyltransferase MiaA, partial [Patescibacteria group bacterium]|nr:tRNA (adenosine(37)-N6)-dimethylallyltransferase MiaA [Patescibacteria group bacterium]
LVEKIDIASRQFAKRQITWFKRWERNGAKIYWVKNKKQAEKLIKNFLLIIF